MSTQFIRNGVYIIANHKYPSAHVFLIGGAESGALAGTKADMGSFQKWIIQGDSNQITIQSLAAAGNYASVPGRANGAPIFASTATPTKWSLVAAGGNSYYIRSLDGTYTWNLPSDVADYTILLRPTEKNLGEEAQWKFVQI